MTITPFNQSLADAENGQSGLISNEPNSYYQSLDHVSNSKLSDYIKSPRLYKQRYIDKKLPKPEAKHFDIGNLFDTLLLDGRGAVDALFSIVPSDAHRKPTKAQIGAKKPSDASVEAIRWWESFEKEANGKTIIDQADMDLVQAMADSAFEHPLYIDVMGDIKDLGSQEKRYTQLVARTQPDKHGIRYQCRFDLLRFPYPERPNVAIAVDVKTIANMGSFTHNYKDYGYYRQEAFYTLVLKEVAPEITIEKFYFFVVEKGPPYEVAVWDSDKPSFNAGLYDVSEAIKGLTMGLTRNHWHAKYTSVMTAKLPLSSFL